VFIGVLLGTVDIVLRFRSGLGKDPRELGIVVFRNLQTVSGAFRA
jgi:hypothetical protein